MTFYTYPFPQRMAHRWMAAVEKRQNERYLAVNVRD